jgi:cleavage and polyadenylation specificity factor subunit 3
VHLRIRVEAISFSAHADFAQTSEFLDLLQPPHVVLVHGEAEGMARLKRELERGAASKAITRSVYMPKISQPVQVGLACGITMGNSIRVPHKYCP